MLPDPLPLPSVISAYTATTPVNWVRMKEGLYKKSTSTLDQPYRLELANTINPSDTSSFVAKLFQDKNVAGTPAYGEKPVPDDRAQIHVVVKWPHRSFSATDIAVMRNDLVLTLMDATFWAAFIDGQR